MLGVAALALSAGCTRRCKNDSLLLSLSSPLPPLAGDLLTVTVHLDANTQDQQTVTLSAPAASGTLEIDFGSRYPRGKTITLEVDQVRGTTTVASNSESLLLTDGCEVIPFALHGLFSDGGTPSDLSGLSADLSASDLSSTPASDLSTPCPVCDPTQASSSTTCISGMLYDFVSNQAVGASAQSIRVAAYAQVDLTSGKPSLSEVETSSGCFILPNVATPQSGLMAIVVEDPTGTTTPTLVEAAIFFTGGANQLLRVDAYRLPKAVVDGWTAGGVSVGDGGVVDYYTQGAIVTQMIDVFQAAGGDQLANVGLNLAGGVTLTQAGAPVPNQRYLAPSRTSVQSGAVATSTAGVAVLPASSFSSITATGGTCSSAACQWPTHVLASTAHVVQIQNYYACNGISGCQ
jgi:hypothetical protein